MILERVLVPLLLALAFVLAGSLANAATYAVDKTVDPYTAVVEWADGKVLDVGVPNRRYCDYVFEAVLEGYDCGIEGTVCGWVPTGRRGVRPVNVTCRRGGPVPGGPCIVGRGGNC